jgi:hypothetical protein
MFVNAAGLGEALARQPEVRRAHWRRWVHSTLVGGGN